MIKNCSKYGQKLLKIWTKIGQNMNMVKNWSNIVKKKSKYGEKWQKEAEKWQKSL